MSGPVRYRQENESLIACYFHRTVRCPTCQKISAYIEEAIKAGFAAELKDKSVRMVRMDFQDAKNQKYAEAYGIDGPTFPHLAALRLTASRRRLCPGAAMTRTVSVYRPGGEGDRYMFSAKPWL